MPENFIIPKVSSLYEEDNRLKPMFDTLSENYDLGTFDEFKQKIENPEKRKGIYRLLSEKYDVGTPEEFESWVVPRLPITPKEIGYVREASDAYSTIERIKDITKKKLDITPENAIEEVMQSPAMGAVGGAYKIGKLLFKGGQAIEQLATAAVPSGEGTFLEKFEKGKMPFDIIKEQSGLTPDMEEMFKYVDPKLYSTIKISEFIVNAGLDPTTYIPLGTFGRAAKAGKFIERAATEPLIADVIRVFKNEGRAKADDLINAMFKENKIPSMEEMFKLRNELNNLDDLSKVRIKQENKQQFIDDLVKGGYTQEQALSAYETINTGRLLPEAPPIKEAPVNILESSGEKIEVLPEGVALRGMTPEEIAAAQKKLEPPTAEPPVPVSPARIAEKVKKARIKDIPQLKSSEEAIAYGQKIKKTDVPLLKAEIERLTKQFDEIEFPKTEEGFASPEFKLKQSIALQKQLLSEAISVKQGKHLNYSVEKGWVEGELNKRLAEESGIKLGEASGGISAEQFTKEYKAIKTEADLDNFVNRHGLSMSAEERARAIKELGIVSQPNIPQKLSKVTGENPHIQVQRILQDGKITVSKERVDKFAKELEVLSKDKTLTNEARVSRIEKMLDDVQDYRDRIAQIDSRKIEQQLFDGEYSGKKYAGSFNLDNLRATDDYKKMIENQAKILEPQFNQARTGGIKAKESILHEAELQKLAAEAGYTYEDFIKVLKAPLTSPKAMALREANFAATKEVHELFKKYNATQNPEDLLNAVVAYGNQTNLTAAYMRTASEAGRTLRVFKGLVKDGMVDKAKLLQRLQSKGYKTNFKKLAEVLSQFDPTDVIGINKMLRGMVRMNNWDKLFLFRLQMMLSNPTTHFANITSNTLTFLSAGGESLGSAAIDILRHVVTGAPRERFFSEFISGFHGLKAGIRDGFSKGLFLLKNRLTTAEATKIELKTLRNTRGWTPVGMLAIEDEFFKGLNQSVWQHSLSMRKALQDLAAKRITKAQLKDRVAKYMQSDEVVNGAYAEALYRTFNNKLGKTGSWVMQGRDMIPAARHVVPFIRTPLNIMEYGLVERTPFGGLAILRALTKGELKGGALSDKLARMTMGSMIGLGIYWMAKDGLITGGGPPKKGEFEALRRTGWQPYSFKIGDTYISYQRLEPLGIIFGLNADIGENFDYMSDTEKYNVVKKISSSLSNNIWSKTYISGLTDIINLINEPWRYGDRYIQNFASSFTPNVVAGITRAIDPDLKDAKDIMDKIKSRIPYASETVLPKFNIWGEVIQRDAVGITSFSPAYISVAKNDPVDLELARLGFGMEVPEKKLGKRELTDAEYTKYIKTAGERAKRRINKLIKSPAYRKVDDDKKLEIVEDIVRAERRRAREMLHLKYEQ